MQEGRLREVEEATDQESVEKKWEEERMRLYVENIHCWKNTEAFEYSIYMLNMEIMALKKKRILSVYISLQVILSTAKTK